MASTLVLTVDRTSLSLAALSITSEGFDPYTLDAYTEPDTAPQNTTAVSEFLHGALVTSSRLNTSTMFMVVTVTADSTAVLETRIAALRRAIAMQMRYTITRTLDGVSETWACQPGGMTPSTPLRKGDVMAFERQYRITVPVYPIPGS